MVKAAETRSQPGFPRELLDQPKEVRLAYFKAYTVAHPLLDQADKAVWNALREPAGALLVFVFGPTGIGKTTLLTHIEKRLVEHALPRMREDQNHVPVLRLDAVAPAIQQFRWADYYQRALMGLREPLIEHKMDYHAHPPIWNAKQQMFVSPRTSGSVANSCGIKRLSCRNGRSERVEERHKWWWHQIRPSGDDERRRDHDEHVFSHPR